MRLIPNLPVIIICLSTKETEFLIAGLRALHTINKQEKTLTPDIRDAFITMITMLEVGVLEQKQNLGSWEYSSIDTNLK